MREYAFDLRTDVPRPTLDILMWGRCGLPLANPHMPHTQPLAAEPRIGSGKARGSLFYSSSTPFMISLKSQLRILADFLAMVILERKISKYSIT